MTPLFKKLNLKDQNVVAIINAPQSFDRETSQLRGVRIASAIEARTDFVIGFAITKAELDEVSQAVGASLKADVVLWIAYPKGTSKRYRAEFNRDRGFDVLGSLGFEPVRQVAIDEDWSALRFRRTDFIRDMKRSTGMTISAAGKARTMGARSRHETPKDTDE